MIRGPDRRSRQPIRRKYPRIKARSGRQTAIGAVKHTMLVASHDTLKAGELYKPPTPNPKPNGNNTKAQPND
jgi:hypothetical protein